MSVQGSFQVDPALLPELRALLQSADGDEPQEVPLTIEGQTFSGRITEPGAYRLMVILADGRVEIQEAVEFELKSPSVKAELIPTSSTSGNRYSGSVTIAGSYAIDPELTPVSLDIIDLAGRPLPLALDINPESMAGEFSIAADCRVLSPGAHQIQARLTDRSQQVLLSAPLSFDFYLPKPKVELKITDLSSEAVYFYGHTDFGDCPLGSAQLPQVTVFVNKTPIKVEVSDGQLPGDFVFAVRAEMLQQGGNVIRVEVIDPRDSEAVGGAEIEVPFSPALTPGGDLLVINDMEALVQKENHPWLLKWANFESSISTVSKDSVLFLTSENTCEQVDKMGQYCKEAITTLGDLYTKEGYEFIDVERKSLGFLVANIKLIILFLPDEEFNEREIHALKSFAEDGGRIVYVGESSACTGCYSEATQAQFFQQMGVDIRQEKGVAADKLYKSIGEQHQLMAGIDIISVVGAGIFAIGENVRPLVISESNQVIAAVAKINTNSEYILPLETGR